MAATLYAVPASHPCAAVERALQLKGIPFRRIDIPPVLHKPVQLALFGGPTVPGLVLDGERILGSRRIVRALDARTPEPRLVTGGEDVELAEGWGDEVLQPVVRRLVWAVLKRSPASLPSYAEGSRPRVPDPLARLGAPAVAWAESRINKASDLDVRADLAHLDRHLERVDRWIEKGVIGGETPNAADLQIASGLRLLLTIGDLAPLIDPRPAGELARRWFPEYPGHTPAGTLPREWLPG
jgi:glutathione S-transferase